MRAKPPKYRSLSFKVFKKGADDRFKPSSETIGIQLLNSAFLGDEPFKFLGRKMSSKKNGLIRAESKENFIGSLEITSKANITGPMKIWLYNHFIVAFITWPFMIYDLTLFFGKELKAVTTKYLKRWLGITKSITESVLYRNKDHFVLGLTDLVIHLKKMHVVTMSYNERGASKTW